MGKSKLDNEKFEKLANLLDKLDIASARKRHVFGTTLTMAAFQNCMQDVMSQFGQPNQLYMDPDAIEVLKNMLGGKK